MMQMKLMSVFILSICFMGSDLMDNHHRDQDVHSRNLQLIEDIYDEEYRITFIEGQSNSAHNRQNNVPHERIASLHTDNTEDSHTIPEALKDKKHGIKMGVPWQKCDDGKTKLTVDWDGNEADYTCYNYEKNWPRFHNNNSTEICVSHPFYMPAHWCMFHKIQYDEPIPYYGDHRPLWPKFGEYNFLPPQRYLHSLEHGAVAFFYHPCARPEIVQQIKSVLISCLRKYIISKNTNLEESAPFLLLAWGCKKFMSGFDEVDIVRFIRKHAMTAPESHTKRQGWYNWGLLHESINPPFGSDIRESNICPHYPPDLNDIING